MKVFWLKIVIFCFWNQCCLLSASKIIKSPVTCSSSDTACNNFEDNLIDTINSVATIEECRQLCYFSKDCEFLTYYGDSFPYRHVCFLFKSCEVTHDCSDCVSETRDCYYSCSKNIVGAIEDNLLEIVSEVKSELECRGHCVSTPSCVIYTYFLEDDPNSGTCVLLSSLHEPIQTCDTCLTGPVDCEAYSSHCFFVVNGEEQTFLNVTEIGVKVNIFIPLNYFADCQLRVFAVGGGGLGDMGSGAGSGYLLYNAMNITGPTNISLVVGGMQLASIVTINGQAFIAEAGHDSRDVQNGADGYSGGGALCNGCDGGSNGGNGDSFFDNKGGHGTGEDISTYKLENWVLSPGVGGQSCYDDYDGYPNGGGGGGVLVNGEFITTIKVKVMGVVEATVLMMAKKASS